MAALSSAAMTAAAATPPPPPPPPPATVAFTTPQNYARRLSRLLALKGHTPLWCPTLSVGPTPQTISSLGCHLRPPALEPFSAIAFTSRAGIAAFSSAAAGIQAPLLAPHGRRGTFIVAALGKDSELLDADLLSRICPDPRRIETLIPRVASPRGLVGSLGRGDRRRILCPVPLVVGIEEPPVVPEFIADLEANGWTAVRVVAYETRWLGEDCAGAIVSRAEGEGLDAIVFTSSGEVEGLLKSLKMGFGWEWEDVRRRWPELVVAAHGPVTAAGAERLGVGVDVVGHKFESFGGVVEALSLKLQECARKNLELSRG